MCPSWPDLAHILHSSSSGSCVHASSGRPFFLSMPEFRKLKLVYDAKRNGWNPAAFHKGVDFKGPGLVVAKTKGGAVVGG